MALSTKYWFVFIGACAAVNIVFYTFDVRITDRRTDGGQIKGQNMLDKVIRKVTPYSFVYRTGLQPTLRPTSSYKHPVRRLKYVDRGLDIGRGPDIDRGPDRMGDITGDDRVFNFRINRQSSCSLNMTEMTVVVISKIGNFLRRSAIRNTWASIASLYNTSIVFLLGSGDSKSIQSQVEREAKLYGDIVQVDLEDSYKSLTFKSISMLQWLNDYCYHAKFLLKADDDIYVNIPTLFKSINNEVKNNNAPDRFFLCHVFKDAPPIREVYSKWYTSYAEYNRDVFPTYCSGTAYLFSSSILTDLYQSSLKTKLLTMEDVFITGLSAENLSVTHLHDGRFSFEKRKPTGCSYKDAISGHEVAVKEMYVIFAQLYNNEIDCETNENLVVRTAEEYD